jgi:hypothetical protein
VAVRAVLALRKRPQACDGAMTTRMLAALLLVALASGCSKGGGAKTPTADPQQGRVYAQCMRDNGVPNFPDPNPDGRFPELSHKQQDDPKFRSAAEKCRDLAPGGEHESFGDPVFVEQMRLYAQCMRDNGLPNFPDPDADGRLRGAGHENQDDPTFRAANEKCRTMLPGGGGHG